MKNPGGFVFWMRLINLKIGFKAEGHGFQHCFALSNYFVNPRAIDVHQHKVQPDNIIQAVISGALELTPVKGPHQGETGRSGSIGDHCQLIGFFVKIQMIAALVHFIEDIAFGAEHILILVIGQLADKLHGFGVR